MADASTSHATAAEYGIESSTIETVGAGCSREIEEVLSIEDFQEFDLFQQRALLELRCCGPSGYRAVRNSYRAAAVATAGATACRKVGRRSLPRVCESDLIGIGAEVADSLVEGPIARTARPLGNQPVEQGELFLARFGGAVFAQDRLEPGAEHAGFAQVAHRAGALHVGQGFRGRVRCNAVGELAIEGIGGQIQVGQRALAAVAAGIAAGRGDQVAVGVLAGGRRAQPDGGDAVLAQRLQFAGLGHAILVEILPDPHAGEVLVLGIERAIGIAVQFAQGVEAVPGLAAIALDGIDAEQFAAVVDPAVAVEVANQQGIVTLDPAGAGFQAVAVEVEGDAGVGGDGFYAVVVEVKSEGVGALDELKRRSEIGVDILGDFERVPPIKKLRKTINSPIP